MISEILTKSSSQAHQDIFAYFVCDTNNGYFIDIGSGPPISMNNTYLLENLGWKGLSFDIDNHSPSYLLERNTPIIVCDVTKKNISEVLNIKQFPKVIDYISIDVDDATEEFLFNNFPSEYKFKCITFEHNLYCGGDLKNKSKQFFIEKGYTLLCENVALSFIGERDMFEDWYINEEYIDIKKVEFLKSNGLLHTEIIDKMIENEKTEKNQSQLVVNDEISIDAWFEEDMVYYTISTDIYNVDIFLVNTSDRRCYHETKDVKKDIKYWINPNDEIYSSGCFMVLIKENKEIYYKTDIFYNKQFVAKSDAEKYIRENHFQDYTNKGIMVEVDGKCSTSKNFRDNGWKCIVVEPNSKLDTILQEAGVERVDFLSIDTKGWGSEVMFGFNTKKYNPRVILLENVKQLNIYETYMEDIGYQLDKKFEYNYIFIKKNKHVNFLEHLVNVRNDSYGLTENLQEMWVKQVEKNIEGFNFDYGIKFSFLIPTYKRHELLQRAINSVFQQKYKNIEILVCSDGDDIDVKNIVESYQDNRIKYYFTERTNNSGASQRNLLSKIATGDFIIFLDDDNYIYENYLDTILKHIEKDDDMIVYKIDIEGHIYPIIPLENKIEHGKIDTLNFIINRKFLSIEWVSLYMHDFIHFKTIEYLLINENKKIKYINAILAKHGANI